MAVNIAKFKSLSTSTQKTSKKTVDINKFKALSASNKTEEKKAEFYTPPETFETQQDYADWRSTIESTPQKLESNLKQIDKDISYWKERQKAYETVANTEKAPTVVAEFRKLYDDATTKLTALEQSKAITEEERQWSEYFTYSPESLSQNSDWDELSKYVSTANGREAVKNATIGYGETGYNDIMYDYINRNEDAIAKQNVIDTALNRSVLGIDDSFLKQMTDDEIATFNYLYALDEKAGDKEHKKAYEFIDYIKSDLTYLQRKQQAEQWSQYAKESPVAASVFSTLMAPTKLISTAGQFADYGATGEVDPNAGYNKFSQIPSDIRSEVGKNIESKWGKVGSFLYETGMSMADFLFNTAVSGGNSTVALTIMGTGAAADTTLDALNRGVDSKSALWLGAVAGAAEAFTERVSLEALLGKTQWSKTAVGYLLSNVLSEGTEEMASELINTIADIIISKDKSYWQAAINAYKAEGLSEEEAFRKALVEKAKEIGLAGLGGALSGGAIGSVGAITGAYNSFAAEPEIDITQPNVPSVAKPMQDPVQAAVVEALDKAAGNQTAATQPTQTTTAPAYTTVLPRAGETLPTVKEVLEKSNTTVNPNKARTFSRAESGIDYSDVSTDEYIKSNAVDGKTLSALDEAAKALGVKVRFADTVAGGNANAQIANGIIDIEKGNSNPLRFLFGHEITHRMQELAPTEYAKLRETVLSNTSDVDAKIKSIQNNYAIHGGSISSEAAMDEIVADKIGEFLENDGELERFIKANQNNRTLLEKLRDIFRDLWNKLKNTQHGEQFKAVEKRLSETLNAAVAQAQTNAEAQKGVASRNRQEYTDGKNAKTSLKQNTGLTEGEEYAVTTYKSPEAYAINAALREGSELSERQKRIVEELDRALIKLPLYVGTVYRNIVFDDFGGQEEYERFMMGVEIGAIMFSSAYTSSSIAPDGYPVEGQYVVHMVIDGRTGRDLEGFGNNFEREVLFERERSFAIRDVSYDENGVPTIYMTEVTINDKSDRNREKNHKRDGSSVPRGRGTREASDVQLSDLQHMQAQKERRSDLQGFSEGDSQRHTSKESGSHEAVSGRQWHHVRTEKVSNVGALLDSKTESASPGKLSLKTKFSLKDGGTIAPISQAISSAKTSIAQIPALFKNRYVEWGKTNIDIGGGKFDLAKNYLAELGVKSMIFDPYNREETENSTTLAFLQSGKRADTATCANVLNVISEPEARANVILETAKAIKADGTAYFMVYEGDGSGEGRQTSAGWQNNRKTADYVGEISEWFETVQRKGKLIIARDPVENLPKASWEIQPGKAVAFSLKGSRELVKEIDRIRSEGTKQGRSEADIKADIEIAVNEAYENMKSKVNKERQKRETAVNETKSHYKAKEKKASEKRKAAELRVKITRHVKRLSSTLLRPSDKHHIPDALQKPLAALLKAINLESYDIEFGKDAKYHRVEPGNSRYVEPPTKRTLAFRKLKEAYTKIAGESEMVIDPDLLGGDGAAGLFDEVIAMGNKRIAIMSPAELETIWKTVRAIEASIRSTNKMFAAERFATVAAAADALRQENKNKTQKTELDGPGGVLGKMQKLVSVDMLTPEAFFHRLGKAGDALFRMMRNAQDEHIRIMKAISDFTHETLGKVDVNALEKEMHTVSLGGEEVSLSTAQLMELYVLMRREQARNHILVGGILPDAISKGGLKKITKAEPVRNITLDEIAEATSLLSAEQTKIADALQKYASTDLSEYGNKASMQVYNYKKFTEENYWPIHSNRQETKSTVESDTASTSVANKGFTRATKPNANTSVKIGSIFDTFSTHASEMATYAAWLATSEDINRIRNFTFRDSEGNRVGTVKGLFDRVHGSQGSAYVQKLLSDIANGVKGTHAETEYMSGIVGNYKAASVGANLRVIIQQPTAILRALDMIEPQYLAASVRKGGWEKALKYAPIAQWKDWGYFDINTGRQMKDVLFESDSKLGKVKQASMWAAGKMDSLSWGMLWNAVEAETKAKHKDLKHGTEEFYKAVAERFTEVVDHTQVVDGILQRSQIMRSGSGLTKMATSFMGEPTKQFNMFLSSIYDVRNSTNAETRKAAKKRLARTTTALLVSGVVNAAAQSIIDALRDDDKEKDYWEKWLAAFTGFTGEEDNFGEYFAAFWNGNVGSIINPAQYIPYAKDVISLLQGYDVARMDMESVAKTITAAQNFIKAFRGGKQTIHGAMLNLLLEASRMLGIPLSNLKRDIWSIAKLGADSTDNYLLQYNMEKFWSNVEYSGNRKVFMDILYKAYEAGASEWQTIYDDLLDSGVSEETIKNAVESRMKKAQGVKSVKDLDERFEAD